MKPTRLITMALLATAALAVAGLTACSGSPDIVTTVVPPAAKESALTIALKPVDTRAAATGITTEGNITGIGFLSIDETPGLGMKAKEPAFKDQFSGKPAATFSVSKTGATSDDQVNAISGATFSSSATTNAVNAAVYFAENCFK